jgi:hypothetical protein
MIDKNTEVIHPRVARDVLKAVRRMMKALGMSLGAVITLALRRMFDWKARGELLNVEVLLLELLATNPNDEVLRSRVERALGCVRAVAMGEAWEGGRWDEVRRG